jgi:hypothetical protein
MIEIRLRPGERRILASPVGLELVDEFTGGAPLGKVRAVIARNDGTAAAPVWFELDVKPILTPSGLLVYPGLNRHPFPINGQPIRSFRVQLTADNYRPIYPPGKTGFEFDAPAFNDVNPPRAPARLKAFLSPNASYPFPAEVPVLRGQVLDHATQAPVTDAEVRDDNRTTVLSDEHGEFALPMRWATAGVILPIDAALGAKVGTLNVKLPDDLSRNLIIEIS